MPKKLSLLALIALLCCAGSAQALSASSPGPASGVTTLASLAEEPELEAETSEDEEFELEECLEDEEEECIEEENNGTEAPPECLLSSAEATVLLAANRDRVRLQVRYTTTAPAAVAVAYGLYGDKGALYLGDERKRFGKKGVLRLNRSLTEAQMAKAMAAKDFTVRLRVLEAPSYCRSFFDQHLDERRATPAGLSWQQSE